MRSFALKTSFAWAKEQVEGILFTEDWNIGIVDEPVHAFLKPDCRPRIRWLANGRKDRFRADPFLYTCGTRKTLLFEEFDHVCYRGVIGCVDLDEHGVVKSSPRPAIDNGVHMSYPYLIEHKGQMYCIPESWQSRAIRAYAFDAGLRQWRIVAPLIEDFPAVDPTVIQHDGHWWLWCTNAEDEPDTKLFLWHAADLLGPWRPHPGNPVKADLRSSRPAGRPFVFEGRLYRPAQDCSRTYGGGITISRVTRLSLLEFHEEPVAYVAPWDKRYAIGIHTLTGDGSFTVLDGKGRVFIPIVARRRLVHKLRRLAQACRGGRPNAARGRWI